MILSNWKQIWGKNKTSYRTLSKTFNFHCSLLFEPFLKNFFEKT